MSRSSRAQEGTVRRGRGALSVVVAAVTMLVLARAWAWPQVRAQTVPEAEGRGHQRNATSPYAPHANKSSFRTVNVQLTYS